jgi:hypothetical protein
MKMGIGIAVVGVALASQVAFSPVASVDDYRDAYRRGVTQYWYCGDQKEDGLGTAADASCESGKACFKRLTQLVCWADRVSSGSYESEKWVRSGCATLENQQIRCP